MLTPLVDTDPDPDVVHVGLVAQVASVDFGDGRTTEVWAYADGNAPDRPASVPGPLLVAKPGDRVVVDLENRLPQAATTLHLHGVRVDSTMDGAANHAGDEVFPGERFRYSFVARDSGTFWYHPHVDTDEQIERGLYGPVVVREAGSGPALHERVIVLDDVDLAADGSMTIAPDEVDLMAGRHGATLLANGRTLPTWDAVAGDVERWRLVNAANGRVFALRLEGRGFHVVESDGGPLPQPYDTRTLRIVPGERFALDVALQGAPDDVLSVHALPVDSGHGAFDAASRPVFRLRLRAGTSSAPRTAVATPFAPLLPASAPVTRTFALRETLSEQLGLGFTINDEAWPFNTPIEGTAGATERWRFSNESDGAHPMHVHGMFFQVLDDTGAPRPDLGWKDTVDVPARSSLDVSISLRRGDWMYHCQIPEHAELGMMGEIHVLP